MAFKIVSRDERKKAPPEHQTLAWAQGDFKSLRSTVFVKYSPANVTFIFSVPKLHALRDPQSEPPWVPPSPATPEAGSEWQSVRAGIYLLFRGPPTYGAAHHPQMTLGKSQYFPLEEEIWSPWKLLTWL